jgi:pimeloyl-ACP methyl ester carboxylesterase
MTQLQISSRDGTPIAYELEGDGPTVILVGGGVTDRSENAPLVPELAAHFTVINYDRRGRGASGDSTPYAVAREIEDIDALIESAGGSAHLFGVSSGGALVLEAAAAGSDIGRFAVFEVPYNVDAEWPREWAAYREELDRALDAGDRGSAFEAFMRVTGSSDDEIAGTRASPFWSDLEAIAHTLRYDAACQGTGQPPTERLGTIEQPALVLTGDDRPTDAPRWVQALDTAADVIAAALRNGQRETLRGQSHVPDERVLATRLAEFFQS